MNLAQWLEEQDYEHGCAVTAHLAYAEEHRDYGQEAADAEEFNEFLVSAERFGDILGLCSPVEYYDGAFAGLETIPF